MKKQILCIILIAVLIALTGCAAKTSTTTATTEHKEVAGYSQESPTANANDALKEKSSAAIARKIVKNGSLTLEADDVEKTYQSILAFAVQNGGYEFKHESTKNGDYLVVTAQIKISPDGLDKLMNFSGKQATVISSKTTSDDITSSYYDSKIRLDTQKKSLQKYYEFLNNAKTLDDTIRVQTEIDRITVEIESLEGQIKLWDALVSESVLDITINQKTDPMKAPKEIKWNALSFKDMGTLMQGGFISLINVVVSVIQWLLIFIVTISPLLVVAAILVFIIVRKRKSKRQK